MSKGPCPFCGIVNTNARNVNSTDIQIKCLGCGASGPIASGGIVDAEQKWNTRNGLHSQSTPLDYKPKTESKSEFAVLSDNLFHAVIDRINAAREQGIDLIVGVRTEGEKTFLTFTPKRVNE